MRWLVNTQRQQYFSIAVTLFLNPQQLTACYTILYGCVHRKLCFLQLIVGYYAVMLTRPEGPRPRSRPDYNIIDTWREKLNYNELAMAAFTTNEKSK